MLLVNSINHPSCVKDGKTPRPWICIRKPTPHPETYRAMRISRFTMRGSTQGESLGRTTCMRCSVMHRDACKRSTGGSNSIDSAHTAFPNRPALSVPARQKSCATTEATQLHVTSSAWLPASVQFSAVQCRTNKAVQPRACMQDHTSPCKLMQAHASPCRHWRAPPGGPPTGIRMP